MKILGLYNNLCAVELFDMVKNLGHSVWFCTDPLSPEWCREQSFDLVVSYTYKYILSSEILRAFDDNVVNIHNSYLPWNRGADPNLWSILEGTPRGVTLHYMSEHLDAGDIIAQCLVPLDKEDTLSSSYYRLDMAAKKLFCDALAYYKMWPDMRKKVAGRGTYHSVKDGDYMRSLIKDYHMPVQEFMQLYGKQ